MALKHAQITYQDISTNDAEYVKLGPFFFGIKFWQLGDCLNIKILSYQFRKSYYKHNMVSQLSYLYNGNPIPGKNVFILRLSPVRVQCKETI